MADIWGKLLLGVLASMVGRRAIGPEAQREVTGALKMWAAEVQRENQEGERQKNLALISSSH